MKFLIIGLGNIGPEYELTRHNIGFLALDQLADKLGVSFSNDRLAYIAEGKFKGKTIHLIKPTTFMNLSGKAVNYWMQQYKIPIENILVITDDIAINFEKIRIRAKGTSGGHNGLKNISEVLGSDIYARMRLGVGSDFAKGRQIDYVLGKFAKEEFEILPEILSKAADASLCFATTDIATSMNQYNC